MRYLKQFKRAVDDRVERYSRRGTVLIIFNSEQNSVKILSEFKKILSEFSRNSEICGISNSFEYILRNSEKISSKSVQNSVKNAEK